MDGFDIAFYFLLIVLFIVLNGFFVSAEFTIVKVRISQLEELIAKGNKRAEYAKHLVDQMDVSLSVTQLGITLASLALGWIGEPFLAELLRAPLAKLGIVGAAVDTIAFALAFSVITAAHIILGELVPKNISIVRPLDMLLAEAFPLLLFQRLTYPFVWFLNHFANWIIHRFMGIDVAEEEGDAHSETEIRILMEESRKKGYIDETEYDFVDNVFDFSDKAVRDVMIPRADMVCLYLEQSAAENVELAIREQLTRYPICREDKDHIIGFLHIKDLMEPLRRGRTPNLRLLARQALVVPETMAVSRLLKTLQKNRAQLAIAVDEYGGTAGMVTVEDIVEEIVGEIQDEFDEERPVVERRGPLIYSVDAKLPIDEINDILEISLDAPNVDTIGGWVYAQGETPPKIGQFAWLDGNAFFVEEVEGVRVTRVLVRLKKELTEEHEEISEEEEPRSDITIAE
ncbi:MAG: HlyC/CorC family transporter [Schwartzia sp.]|nr:HlyC/CorC family transporter [Schwartzia sp. (in: firmicutes)]